MHKFLAALEEAGYEREDNPAQAVLLRDLVKSLSSGKLLLVPTDAVWLLDEEKREDFAIANRVASRRSTRPWHLIRGSVPR